MVQPVTHDTLLEGGLFTHRNSDDFLTFGIATQGGNGYNDLDWSYTVFVQVLVAEDVKSKLYLDMVAESPIYYNDRLSP